MRAEPGRPIAHHLLALALLRAGRADEALDALERGIRYTKDSAMVDVLIEDTRLVAAVQIARGSTRALPLLARLGVGAAARPSLRVVMGWESEAPPVHLFVYDRSGEHTSHRRRLLSSGGDFLAEAGARGARGGVEELFLEVPEAFPYRIGVRAEGGDEAGAVLGTVLGTGFEPVLGTVQVIRHDGKGGLSVEDRPFVLQRAGAMAELGWVRGAR